MEAERERRCHQLCGSRSSVYGRSRETWRRREPLYFEDLMRFATAGNMVGIKTYLTMGPQIHEVLPLVAALAV